MFKFLKDRKKDNKGFTLVELVILVAILAILVGLLAPQYTKYVEKSRQSADVDNLEEMVKAVQVYVVDERTEASGTTTLTATITLTKDGVTIVDADNKVGVTAALEEYVPNYSKTTRKAKQWSADPNVKLEVKADGGITITYGPDDFAEAAGQHKTA